MGLSKYLEIILRVKLIKEKWWGLHHFSNIFGYDVPETEVQLLVLVHHVAGSYSCLHSPITDLIVNIYFEILRSKS